MEVLSARLVLGVTGVFTGALLIALAVPLVRRRVAPNRFYGVRTKDTLADARVWYDVNEVGGRDLMRYGWMNVAAAAAFFAIPGAWFDGAVALYVALVLAGALYLAVRGVRLGRSVRAAYEARDRGNRPA